MAENDITLKLTISKTLRRYKSDYIKAHHEYPTTGIARYYSQHPNLHLMGRQVKGNEV